MKAILILYSRAGCCLCEGLEKRLRTLQLQDLKPSLELCVIDIDGHNVPDSLRARFDLKVPVMVLECDEPKKVVELPMVSPRIQGTLLLRCLQKSINKSLIAI